MTKKFSDRVLNLRSRLGLSQDAFAKRLGVSRNYVSMIEQGREPSDSLKKLIETLETPAPAGLGVVREEPALYQFTPRYPATSTKADDAASTLAACHTLLDSFIHVTSAETFEFAKRALMEKLEALKQIKLS